ncbi:MAG: DUF190 domain-containing protein [Gammaproteobacteria bacterium]
MKTIPVSMVRVYLTEEEGLLKRVLNYLHDQACVGGVTVFRGVTGFGHSGKMHSSTLMDLSLDLPVVVEFFDDPERIDTIVRALDGIVEPGHIVCWPARVRVKDAQ